MKLEKTLHSILGGEVWRLSQRYIDASGQEQIAMTKFAFMAEEIDLADHGRRHLAERLRNARAAVREFVAGDSQ